MCSCHPLGSLATDNQAGEESEKRLEGWSGVSREEKSCEGATQDHWPFFDGHNTLWGIGMSMELQRARCGFSSLTDR